MRRLLVTALVVLAVAATTLVVAAARDPRPAPAMRTIPVSIEHSRFTPTAIAVEPGSTVRFVIENTDPIDHEFILGDQQVQDVHEAGTGHHHGDVPGEISVPAGSTRTTTFTFEGPGSQLFGCHLPAHWDYGMRGTITIV